MNVAALYSNKEIDPKIVAKIDMNFKFISIINLTNQKTYEIVTEMLKNGDKKEICHILYDMDVVCFEFLYTYLFEMKIIRLLKNVPKDYRHDCSCDESQIKDFKLIADENFEKLTHGLGVYLNIFTIHLHPFTLAIFTRSLPLEIKKYRVEAWRAAFCLFFKEYYNNVLP